MRIQKQSGFAPLVMVLIIIGVLVIGGGVLYLTMENLKKQSEEPNQIKSAPTEYKEPAPMPAPKTNLQSIRFDLPPETPLNNEKDLTFSSFYGSIGITGQDIKEHKIISIKITDTQGGQLLILSKKLDSGETKYDIPIYFEKSGNINPYQKFSPGPPPVYYDKTENVYPVNSKTISLGLIWFNPLMMSQPKELKPLLMEKIEKDTQFYITLMGEVEYLLKTKPEEIGGDFQGERGQRLIKLATLLIKHNLEQKTNETNTSQNYFDCKDSKICLAEKAKNCELAKGKITVGSETIEHIINGEDNGRCLYSSKILASSYGLAGLEINCKLPNDVLSQSFSKNGLDQNIVLSNCSGSYIDYLKKNRP